MNPYDSRISTDLPKPTRRMAAFAAALFCSGVASLNGQSFLINFGSEVSNDTNSPMHQDGGVTGENWNLISGAAVTSDIVDSSGGTTAVSIELVRVNRSQANDPLAWGANLPVNGSWNTFSTTGIYAGNARSASYISQVYLDLAVRFKGLAAGEYDLYFSSRFTNSTNEQQYSYHGLAVDSSTGGFNTNDYADFTSQTIVYSDQATWAAGTPNVWTANEDYGVLRFTVGEDEDYVLVIEGINDGASDRSFLNLAGVVAVPEPASLGLILSGFRGVVVLVARRPSRRLGA